MTVCPSGKWKLSPALVDWANSREVRMHSPFEFPVTVDPVIVSIVAIFDGDCEEGTSLFILS